MIKKIIVQELISQMLTSASGSVFAWELHRPLSASLSETVTCVGNQGSFQLPINYK